MKLDYGSWRIVGDLGFGSYGKVYEIEQTDQLGVTTRAALKIIEIPQRIGEIDELRGTGLDNQQITEHFQLVATKSVEEVALMSSVQGHSNIVNYQAHEVRKHKDGFGWDIYLQMELLTSLHKYTKSHSMETADIIRLGIDMCRALELCSKNGIIHRDIKPDNIFVSRSGDYKLGDFGVATIRQNGDTEKSRKGTISYMAPEVFWMRDYDHRADIYSLGIVLYQLLNNGLLPFMETPLDDKEAANIKRLQGEYPLLGPSNAEGMLKAIVMKACAYQKEDRYASATQMIQDLEKLKGGAKEGTIRIRPPEKPPEKPPEPPLNTKKEQTNNTDDPNDYIEIKKHNWLPILLCLLAILTVAVWFFVGKTYISSLLHTSDGVHYDLKDGELIISGTGEIPDYESANDAPWATQKPFIKTITIDEGITSIGSYSFANCDQLIEVNLPENLKSINSCAFSSCTSLKKMELPNTIVSILPRAFSNCTALNTIVLPDSLEYIGDGAFSGCMEITEIRIPTTVSVIDTRAFFACNSLERIIVEEGNTSFSSSEGILFDKKQSRLIVYPAGKKDEIYTAPDTVVEISSYSFCYCSHLSQVIFLGDVRIVSSQSIINCSLRKLDMSHAKAPAIEQDAYQDSVIDAVFYSPEFYEEADGRMYGGKIETWYQMF